MSLHELETAVAHLPSEDLAASRSGLRRIWLMLGPPHRGGHSGRAAG